MLKSFYIDKLKPFLPLLFLLTFLFASFLSQSYAQSSQDIPLRPCDFYGTEEFPQALRVGAIISAKDPQGVTIGRFTITTNGKYGFLSCSADNPNTPEDEGAVNGDTITFYLNGNKQQKQAIWKSGDAIKVGLGVPFEGAAFNLHLTGMPGYTNYDANPNFSGVAVADMILDYLDPANSDTQLDLMAYVDRNSDEQTSGSELSRLLNYKAPSVYNFSSTSTISRYSDWGIIDEFDSTNQSDCLRQICHWLAYKVPQAQQGKEYVPVAAATSADPALGSDSDYKHWMSVVGIKTNLDPFPSISDYASFREKYRAPDSLELYGVYLNDPGQSGLGFHTYMTADVWTQKYFRPIADGLEGQGSYLAIMEPPDNKALPVTVLRAKHNFGFQITLSTPQTEVSFFIPRYLNPQTKKYLLSLFEHLKTSSDFLTLIDDSYFGPALANTTVKRCFKVDGRLNKDYTIVPFDKIINNRWVTTAAAIINNATGQFQIAFADPEAKGVFRPFSWRKAYYALRKQIGWRERPINRWLSNSRGSPLFPGWSIVTLKRDRKGLVQILTTSEYIISPQGEVNQEKVSPQIEITANWVFRSRRDWIKIIVFKVTASKGYTVAVDKKIRCKDARLYNKGNRWFLIMRGSRRASCRLKIRAADSSGNIRQGGLTYVYIRR